MEEEENEEQVEGPFESNDVDEGYANDPHHFPPHLGIINLQTFNDYTGRPNKG